MPARALLVLLVMLNFGVATWWLLRPGPLPPTPWIQPEGVQPLRLLGEADDGADRAAAGQAPEIAGNPDVAAGPGAEGADPAEAAVPQPVAEPAPAAAASATGVPGVDAVSVAVAPAPASPLRCLSFGPYADAASVAAARGALQPLGAMRTRVRDVVDAPRGWRVAMAPQSDRAAADALAARIREAGFDDLLVIPSGDEANAIALGRYGSEPAARRREAALRGAGFPAQAQPLGEASTRHWLDFAAGPTFDAAAARTTAGAAEAREIDCADVVAVASR